MYFFSSVFLSQFSSVFSIEVTLIRDHGWINVGAYDSYSWFMKKCWLILMTYYFSFEKVTGKGGGWNKGGVETSF